MYLDLNRFSFMGIHNSETLLSEKDPKVMEIDFLVRPTLEFQDDLECKIAPSQDGEKHSRRADNDRKFPSSELEIKVPSLDVKNEAGGDELKTPKSLDHRIPTMLKCPPAPRKPKSLPSAKRKEVLRRRILLDLTKEIESLFPPALLADLGNKIKKVGRGSDFK